MAWTAWLLLILAAGVLGLGSALQSAAGFGFALLTVPLLAWAGFPLPQVIAMVLSAMSMQSALAVWHHQADWRPRALGGPLLMAIGGLMVGLALLRGVAGMEPEAVRAFVGGVLLAVLALQRWRPPQLRSFVHPGWTGAALAGSGVLCGVAGMAGPPLVLWAYAHDWPQTRIRTTLWSLFLGLNLVQLPVMTVLFGEPAVRGIVIGLLASPVVYLGARVGLWLTRVASRETLARAASALLALIGLSGVVDFLFHYVG